MNVTGITLCPSTKIINIGESVSLTATVYPTNATNQSILWCSSDPNVATVGTYTGIVSACGIGTSIIYAKAQDNYNLCDLCQIYCDTFFYELIKNFGFSNNDAMLIRLLYDKINDKFASDNSLMKSWKYSRLLGGIVYGNESSGMNAQFKWKDVAGQVFSTTEESYFVNVIGYTQEEYIQLKNAIITQHNNTTTPDFAHMQISLSARLAYKLNLDGFLSNIGTFCSDEDISYLAGWLGDATITNSDGKTSMGDDDYCADLDAENIYRLIIQNQNVIEATNIYYTELFLSATRAGIFLRHINYDTIQNKVFSQLNLKNETDSMNKIKDEYPDTYNFLCSIKDGLAHISQY